MCVGEAGARGWLEQELVAPGRGGIVPALAAACTQCVPVVLCARMSDHLPMERRQDLTWHSGTSGLLHWSCSWFGGELKASVAL